MCGTILVLGICYKMNLHLLFAFFIKTGTICC